MRGQDIFQFLRVARLEQVVIEASLHDAFACRRVVIAGFRDQEIAAHRLSLRAAAWPIRSHPSLAAQYPTGPLHANAKRQERQTAISLASIKREMLEAD